MKLILNTLLIILIIATISICAIQPDMHKNVIVYDSAYTLVTEQEVKTETKDVPVMQMPAKPVEVKTQVDTRTEPKVKTTNVTTNVVKARTKTLPKQSISTNKVVTKQIPNTTVKTSTVKTKELIVEKKIVTQPEPKIVQIKQEQEPPKVLTQQEETIAWNIWRSNLTNKIMQDTRLPDIPNGVLFQFSFTVDKYGKITNVQTGANPSNYTPYAIQYIAPVIRSYQGKSILNFPEGTARTVTQVTGKWRISTTEKFSTPQDYNDLERVIR